MQGCNIVPALPSVSPPVFEPYNWRTVTVMILLTPVLIH